MLPSEAGVGLQWAPSIAAVVLSTKLPDTSALGRMRLLQEVLSIVDHSAADLNTPIVERKKGFVYVPLLIAALPLLSVKLDWLE